MAHCGGQQSGTGSYPAPGENIEACIATSRGMHVSSEDYGGCHMLMYVTFHRLLLPPLVMKRQVECDDDYF